MDPNYVQLCREWIARRTAQLDQRKKQYEAQYDMCSPAVNKQRLEDIEAIEFWISIHSWELERMIETDSDDYPQRSDND